MGVRHEGVRHAHELARRQRTKVAQVEHEGPPREAEVDEEARVAERIVDQPGLHQPGHRPLPMIAAPVIASGSLLGGPLKQAAGRL
jgi:hypothetical protein